MIRPAALLLMASALAGCTTVPRQSHLTLAITIDDLPLHGPIPKGSSPQGVAEELIAALHAGGATQAMGFVNGHWIQEQPATADVLQEWRRAGLPLGNHGWAHRNLEELTSTQFEQELVRNETVLASRGARADWHWFRYPFLSEGSTQERRTAARSILARHGYKVAAVTMDFSDWRFTAPYARCIERDDAAGVARLEQLYLEGAARGIDRSRDLSAEVHGRDIPYVLLLHSGAFTARMMPRLLGLYRSKDFRFISIDTAERDPAYATDVAAARDGAPATLEGRAAARGLPIPPSPVDDAAVDAVCA